MAIHTALKSYLISPVRYVRFIFCCMRVKHNKYNYEILLQLACKSIMIGLRDYEWVERQATRSHNLEEPLSHLGGLFHNLASAPSVSGPRDRHIRCTYWAAIMPQTHPNGGGSKRNGEKG